MLSNDKPYTLDSVIRMILGAGFVAALIWLLGYLSGALIPFVAALLLAYLLNPVTSLMEKGVKSRGVAVGLTLVGLIGVITGLVWLVVPMMAKELSHMGKVLSDLATNPAFSSKVRAYLPDDIWEWLQTYATSPEAKELFTSDGATQLFQSVSDKILPGIKNVARGTASVLSGLLGLGIILLYVIFLLADFGSIQEKWQDYLPANYRQPIAEFLADFESTMSRYFRGQVTIAILVGVLLSVGFVIIDLPLAIVLGMFAGILNIAPYLGVVGIVPATLLAAIGAIESGSSPLVAVGLVLVVFAVVQAIQEAVLVPKIQGQSLGLSPWLILLALSVWGQLLGFLGLLIALPMTCLCLSYYRRLLATRETS